MTRPRIYELKKDRVNRRQNTYGSWILDTERYPIAIVRAVATPTTLIPARASVHDRLPMAWERHACTPDELRLCRGPREAIAAASLSEQGRHLISVRYPGQGGVGR